MFSSQSSALCRRQLLSLGLTAKRKRPCWAEDAGEREPDRKGNIQHKVRANKVKVNIRLLIYLGFVYTLIRSDLDAIQICVMVEQVVGALRVFDFTEQHRQRCAVKGKEEQKSLVQRKLKKKRGFKRICCK